MKRFSLAARGMGRTSSLLPAVIVCLMTPIWLSGCGAAKNAINSSLPTIDNALQLNGQTVTGNVDGSRSVISGNGSRTVTFANTTLNQASALTEIRHTQKLAQTVTVTVPSGAVLPTSFQLRNIALALTLSDVVVNSDNSTSERSFSANIQVGSTVSYIRNAATNTYSAATTPTFNDLVISGNNLSQFRNIITGGGNQNKMDLRVSFDTDDTALPRGSQITFTFTGGTAKIKI